MGLLITYHGDFTKKEHYLSKLSLYLQEELSVRRERGRERGRERENEKPKKRKKDKEKKENIEDKQARNGRRKAKGGKV